MATPFTEATIKAIVSTWTNICIVLDKCLEDALLTQYLFTIQCYHSIIFHIMKVWKQRSDTEGLYINKFLLN